MKLSIDEVLSFHGATASPSEKLQPKTVVNVNIVRAHGESCLIFWNNPNDNTFSKVNIVRNYDHIPTSITDGVLLYSGKGNIFDYEKGELGSHDKVLRVFEAPISADSTIVYFSFFSQSTDGMVSEEYVSRIVEPIRGDYYGYSVDESIANPSDAVTYIGLNSSFTPARNTRNGTAGTFSLNSWENSYPFNTIKPCTLNANGSFNKYVNPNDYSMHTDGTSVSGYNVFVEVPPIYFYIERETPFSYSVYLASTQINSKFRALAHERAGVMKGNLYVGAYQGNFETVNGVAVLSSKSDGLTTYDGVTRTMSEIRTLAKANGEGYELYTYRMHALFIMLFVLLGKSLDSQKLMRGNVFSESTTYLKNNGSLDTAGLFYGDVNSNTSVCKFCGIENIIGNYRVLLDGLYFALNSKRYYINDFSVEVTNNTTTEYTSFPIKVNSPISVNGFYVTKVFANMDGLFLPMEAEGGSSSTYYCDTTTTYYSSYTLATVSGFAGEGDGMFKMYFYQGTGSKDKFTGRLIYLAE